MEPIFLCPTPTLILARSEKKHTCIQCSVNPVFVCVVQQLELFFSFRAGRGSQDSEACGKPSLFRMKDASVHSPIDVRHMLLSLPGFPTK